MRVFVTGGSGFIGSAVVPELITAGHQVAALARSDATAQALADAGAEVVRGDLEDLATLRAAASASDGVIHLAFIHDFSNPDFPQRFKEVSEIDQRAIETMGTALEGSGRPLAIASGLLGLAPGRVAMERDVPAVDSTVVPRLAGVETALSFASRGVRSSIVRLAPTVHGEGDHGFVPRIIDTAREKGVSAYVGDGANRWPGVHRLDAAKLFRLALEAAPAGSALHGTADEGIPMRTIAEIIGRHLDIPVRSITPEEAGQHFGFFGHFLMMDAPSSNTLTRKMLGWEPTHVGLVEDLEQGHYFRNKPQSAVR